MKIENVIVKAELILELESKNDWIRRVPRHLPNKTRGGEQWIWLDVNGNVFECGRDFTAAENAGTYPCKVYRVQCVADANNQEKAQ